MSPSGLPLPTLAGYQKVGYPFEATLTYDFSAEEPTPYLLELTRTTPCLRLLSIGTARFRSVN